MTKQFKKNTVHAKASDKSRVISTSAWCYRHNQTLAGLPYFDDLDGPDGISLGIMITKDTPEKVIQDAIREGYIRHDVVRHYVMICPEEWLEASGNNAP